MNRRCPLEKMELISAGLGDLVKTWAEIHRRCSVELWFDVCARLGDLKERTLPEAGHGAHNVRDEGLFEI